MPPAPAIPTTMAERASDSERWSTCPAITGSMPKRIASMWLQPEARTPPEGRPSASSTTSVKSLPVARPRGWPGQAHVRLSLV